MSTQLRPILICGTPVSKSNDGKDVWEKEVGTEVGKHWKEAPLPADHRVGVTITYFAEPGVGPHDLDNLAKPILDAMKGIVYQDDNQVSDLLCRMRCPKTDPPPRNPPAGMDECLDQSKPVLIIDIDTQPCLTVEFAPEGR